MCKLDAAGPGSGRSGLTRGEAPPGFAVPARLPLFIGSTRQRLAAWRRLRLPRLRSVAETVVGLGIRALGPTAPVGPREPQ
jgi:hypothetical protein